MTDHLQVRRDALGRLFFAVHLGFLAYVLAGWAWPETPAARIAYLVFLPGLAAHWRLNGGQCVLNNLESWVRWRRWRAPERNPEEGAWLRTLLTRTTGLVVTKPHMDIVLHAGLSVLWLMVLARLLAGGQ